MSIGWYIFEQFARETNLKKKRSVSMCVVAQDNDMENYVILRGQNF